MTSPTSKKYDMEYKLYHLTFTYDDLTTIAGALDFQLNNIDFCGDELEECPVEDFLNKVKNEELEQTGWKPQTRIGECKGCKMICDECENLSIVRDKITKKQYINLKNKWLDDFYSTYPYYNIVKLKKRLYKRMRHEEYTLHELEEKIECIKSMTYTEALSKISS